MKTATVIALLLLAIGTCVINGQEKAKPDTGTGRGSGQPGSGQVGKGPTGSTGDPKGSGSGSPGDRKGSGSGSPGGSTGSGSGSPGDPKGSGSGSPGGSKGSGSGSPGGSTGSGSGSPGDPKGSGSGSPGGSKGSGSGESQGRDKKPKRKRGSTIDSAVEEQLKKLNLNLTTLATTVSSLSTAKKDDLCIKALKLSAEIIKLLSSAGADCFGAIGRATSVTLSRSQAAGLLFILRKGKQPEKWTKAEWSTVFKYMRHAIRISDLKKMTPEIFKELVNDGVIEKAVGDLMSRKAVRQVLGKQLTKAFGAPSTWDLAIVNKLKPFIGLLSVSDINSLPSTVIQVLGNTNCQGIRSPAMRALADRYIKSIGPAASWTASDVKKAGCLICNNQHLLGNLPEAVMQGALSTLSACNSDATHKGAAYSRALRRSINPANMTKENLRDLRDDVRRLGRGALRKIPADVVKGSISILRDFNLTRAEAAALMKKIKETPSKITAAKLRDFGKLARGFSSKELSEIPIDAFAQLDSEAFANLTSMDFDKGQCRAIVKKVKAGNSHRLSQTGKLMSKCMSPDDISSLSLSALGLDCATNTPPKFAVTKAIAKKLMKKIRNGLSASTYNLTCLQNWGSVVRGMNGDDFNKMLGDGDFAQKIGILAAHASHLDEHQIKNITKLVREYLQMDNATAVKALGVDVAEEMGAFMTHFSDAELDKFPASVKTYLAKKFGKLNLDRLQLAELIRLKNFYLKNIERDGTEAVSDQTSSTTLDDNDIRDIGCLARGLEVGDFNKMTAATVASNIQVFQEQVRGLEKMKAVLSRLDATYFDYADNITAAIGLAGAMDIDAIDAKLLVDIIGDISAGVLRRRRLDNHRDKVGFKNEVSEKERDVIKQNVKKLLLKALDSSLDGAQTSGSRRKRRSVSSITCSDIQVLGESADILTTTHINSLSSSEFADCTEMLGAIDGWSSDQLASLIAIAKATYGSDASSWSDSDTKLTGTMLAGLTSSEISKLNLASADTLATMGTSSMFSRAQMKAGFDRFLAQARGNKADDVTGDDLIIIGSFVCGAGTEKINLISPANYKMAAASIGAQTTCDSAQLEAFAALAKSQSAYGDPSTWDAATISTVGVVVGGLTAAEIDALTVAQVQGISAETIPNIPAGKLADFSTKQLTSLSSPQANSITPSQQKTMSTSQRESLNLNTGQGPKSSASSIGATILLLLPLLPAIL